MLIQVLSLALLPALVGSSPPASDGNDEVLLVQRSVVTKSRDTLDTASTTTSRLNPDASWATGPFGACEMCLKENVKFRSVWCARYDNNDVLPSSDCDPNFKPAPTKACSCGTGLCVPAKSFAACEEPEQKSTIQPGDPAPILVGCFKLSPGDDHTTCGEKEHDLTCEEWPFPGACRSGLPFFRHCDWKLDDYGCAEFCFRQGYDLAGMVHEKECRCGAAAVNENQWRHKDHHHGSGDIGRFQFHPDHLERVYEEGFCPLRVYRWGGYYESGGLPHKFIKRRLEGDQQYADSIATGEDTWMRLDSPMVYRPDGRHKYGKRNHGPAYERHCWPEGDCGPANLWDERTPVAPAGVDDVWQDYVIVRYEFDHILDAVRREAWLAAADMWMSGTCIIVVEAEDPLSLRINVSVADEGSCWAVVGSSRYSEVNLGWCNSMAYVGNIAHEIGHVLGMVHEQQRPDAQQEYHGHGPFVTVHWQHISDDWKGQYAVFPYEDSPMTEGYMGSANDGEADPQVGYASYDYESIMHYGRSDKLEPTDPAFDNVIGQRLALSEGDLRQVNDMYQCWPKGGATSTTTAPAFGFWVEWSCDYGSINGWYSMVGHTASGAPYYKQQYAEKYLYFEPRCGNGNFAPMWVFNAERPSETADYNLDDSDCVIFGGSYGGSLTSPPMGIGSWVMYCKTGWVVLNLNLRIPTTTTVTTTTITTSITMITTSTTITTTTITTVASATPAPAPMAPTPEPAPAPGAPAPPPAPGPAPPPPPPPAPTTAPTTTAPSPPSPPPPPPPPTPPTPAPPPTTPAPTTTVTTSTTVYQPPQVLRWIEPVTVGCLSVLTFCLTIF